MGLLKLAIDRQNKTLVIFDGSVAAIPPLYQTNTQTFQITVVDPVNGSPYRETYTKVDCAAYGLRAVVSVGTTGATGDETSNLLAATYEAGWSWDADNLCFTGSVDCNTASLNGSICNL